MGDMATESSLFQGYGFEQSHAFAELKKLAEAPFDLTDLKELNSGRLKKLVGEACGFKLLYGTQRVTPKVMQALRELSLEAGTIEKMEAQQAGEVMNFIEGHESENRKVLHTALRDFSESTPEAKLAQEEVSKLETFMNNLSGFTDLVFIGIGGSELGPKTLYYGLQGLHLPDRRIHFISNVDPDDTALALDRLDLKTTLAVVVSKSGGTLETKTNEDLVRHHFEQADLDPSEHFVAATGKGSPMDDPSRYMERFYVWDWVGGRYCATSVIGGIVLSFAYGVEVFREVLRGAHEMDQAALERDLHHNIPLLAALLGIWNRNFLNYPTVAIIPYSQMLIRFAAHIQQVDMESNGKRIDRKGESIDYHSCPIVWGEPATNAQHSFFQMIHQGTDPVPLEMVGFKESQWGEDLEQNGTTSQEKLLANLMAQALALATGQSSGNPNKVFPGNRPSSILLGKKLTPYALGALLAFYEHKIAFQGYIWNINSFDQEGVQLGKVLANRVLGRIESRKKKEEGEEYPLGDALLDVLKNL